MSGPSIDEILEDYRNAGVGGHLVGGGVLRALCAEIDRLRERLAELERPTDATEVVDQQQFCDEMRFRGIGLGGSDGR